MIQSSEETVVELGKADERGVRCCRGYSGSVAQL
jgi:hypothetical protein